MSRSGWTVVDWPGPGNPPEKRKVGSSILPLTTTTDQRKPPGKSCRLWRLTATVTATASSKRLRRRLSGSMGVPRRDGKTRPWSSQSGHMSARSANRRFLCSRSASAQIAGSGTVRAESSVFGGTRRSEPPTR